MKLKIGFALFALAGSSFAALVSVESLQGFDGVGDTGFTLPSGAPVTVGLARVGIFSSLTDLQVADFVAAKDYSFLATFNGLAQDNFVDGLTASWGAPIAGMVSMSVDGLVPTGSNTLYTYVTSGEAFALFQHNSALVPDAAPPALPTNYLLNLTDGQILIGGVGPAYIADFDAVGLGNAATLTGPSIQLIPEPSAALLGALGVLGLLRRRRI